MKKNIFNKILLGALVGLSGACTEEVENPNVAGFCTITAQIDDFVGTRTCVDESVTDQINMQWQKGESIGVYTTDERDNGDYGTYGMNLKFTSNNEQPASKTGFTGNITGTGTPKCAYYPYTTNNNRSFSTAVKGELPLVQSYSTTEKKVEYDWKVGTPVSTSSPYTFTFTHLFSLVRFSLNVSGTDLVGDRLKSITLTFPKEVTLNSGNFTVNLETRDVAWTQSGENEMTLNVTDTPALAEGTSNLNLYMVCPPAEVSGKIVTLKVTTDKHIASLDAKLNGNLAANMAYNFPLTLTEWKDNTHANYKVTDADGNVETEENAKWVKGLDSKLACANTVFAIQGQPFMHKIRVPDYTEYNKTSAANLKPYVIEPVKTGIKRVYNLPEGLTWNETRCLVEGSPVKAGDHVYSVEFEVGGVTYKEGIKLHVAESKDKLLSPTPIIGWQTWNVLGEDISYKDLVDQLDGMKSLGLIDAGYKYFGIDDAWQKKDLDDNGHQITESDFPSGANGENGMKVMADKIHSYGLKAGIYTDCGRYTCGGGGNAYAGSYDNEVLHAQDYKDWGYDFVKEDWYYNTTMSPGVPFTTGYDGLDTYWNTKEMAQELYTRMGTALADRGIILYMCEWGIHDPWKWGAETGATCWRMSYDDSNAWKAMNEDTYGPNEGVNNNRVGVYSSIVLMRNLWPYVGINRYNDADMLCVGIDQYATGPGNQHCYSGAGLTEAEAQTAFAMWCMWSSPILLGFDMTQGQSTIFSKLGYDAVGLLKNTKLVAIHQDPLGQGAEFVNSENGCDYYMKDLANGDVAIAVVNLSDSKVYGVSIQLSDYEALDSSSSYSATNLFTNTVEGTLSFSSSLKADIDAHGTYIIRVSKK